ncbi:RNA polymerase sigma factor [Croceimicrobium sp.]|uniref:RNA polymerase sigma factor n=1 Tax=Croceimicrobium sp. TaxID=2828340 RepID=UPI003BAB0E51
MQEPGIWKEQLQKQQYQTLFGNIVEAYTERLYWHIRSILLRHDWSDDVLQECFIKAWKALPSFRGDAAFYTWLYRIATNEALAHLKKERRFQWQEGALNYHLSADPYFDGDEALKSLLDAVAELPDKQQTVFKLKYFQNLSFKEMSEMLNTSVGALKASFHHAKEKVKVQLNLNEF